jgi:hypothetical protein
MKHARLNDMIKGWFVGDFEPSVIRSDVCEVAVKHYQAGDQEETHHHRVAAEITLIVSGQVWMMGRTWDAGDIVLVEPGEATDFKALTDAVCTVVKLPSVRGDKYLGELPAK